MKQCLFLFFLFSFSNQSNQYTVGDFHIMAAMPGFDLFHFFFHFSFFFFQTVTLPENHSGPSVLI